MSISEFRWNKKRKHYCYIFQNDFLKRLNILISTKPFIMRKGKKAIKNIPLFRHPNPKKSGCFYLVPRIYADHYKCFDDKQYDSWNFDLNDKRKVKRIKKSRYFWHKEKAGS